MRKFLPRALAALLLTLPLWFSGGDEAWGLTDEEFASYLQTSPAFKSSAERFTAALMKAERDLPKREFEFIHSSTYHWLANDCELAITKLSAQEKLSYPEAAAKVIGDRATLLEELSSRNVRLHTFLGVMQAGMGLPNSPYFIYTSYKEESGEFQQYSLFSVKETVHSVCKTLDICKVTGVLDGDKFIILTDVELVEKYQPRSNAKINRDMADELADRLSRLQQMSEDLMQ